MELANNSHLVVWAIAHGSFHVLFICFYIPNSISNNEQSWSYNWCCSLSVDWRNHSDFVILRYIVIWQECLMVTNIIFILVELQHSCERSLPKESSNRVVHPFLWHHLLVISSMLHSYQSFKGALIGPFSSIQFFPGMPYFQQKKWLNASNLQFYLTHAASQYSRESSCFLIALMLCFHCHQIKVLWECVQCPMVSYLESIGDMGNAFWQVNAIHGLVYHDTPFFCLLFKSKIFDYHGYICSGTHSIYLPPVLRVPPCWYGMSASVNILTSAPTCWISVEHSRILLWLYFVLLVLQVHRILHLLWIIVHMPFPLHARHYIYKTKIHWNKGGIPLVLLAVQLVLLVYSPSSL